MAGGYRKKIFPGVFGDRRDVEEAWKTIEERRRE
jgi:hypothetical protein